MRNLSLIRSKEDFIISLLPQAADAVKPHGPRFITNAYIDLLIADVVKEISALIHDRALAKRALELSKKMAEKASSAMLAGWEPGDDICPPWPWPGPGPISQQSPVPDPWKPVVAAEQVELAHILTQLAGLTTHAEINQALKTTATQLARGVAGALADEFERCGTVPRKPLPRPRGIPVGLGVLAPAKPARALPTMQGVT